GQALRVTVQAQHGFQPGQRDLAHAQRALERILLDFRDELTATDQNAGLWPTEQLVAGKGDQIGACCNRFAWRWLMWQTPGLQASERARTEVFHKRQATGMGNRRDFAL